tara:strand:- start:30 stop:431 length:402 start_codon:yes stop_codon:yes gene_type:complete
MGVFLRIIAKLIVLLLAIYCISVIIGFFVGYSITFPFSFIEGRYVPEHRLHAIRLATLGTFFYFSLYYLFLGSKKLYPIQFMGVFLFNLSIVGPLSYLILGTQYEEYLQSLFFFLASIVLYNSHKPQIRNYFR